MKLHYKKLYIYFEKKKLTNFEINNIIKIIFIIFCYNILIYKKKKKLI